VQLKELRTTIAIDKNLFMAGFEKEGKLDSRF
jgi:hypothetical protein